MLLKSGFVRQSLHNHIFALSQHHYRHLLKSYRTTRNSYRYHIHIHYFIEFCRWIIERCWAKVVFVLQKKPFPTRPTILMQKKGTSHLRNRSVTSQCVPYFGVWSSPETCLHVLFDVRWFHRDVKRNYFFFLVWNEARIYVDFLINELFSIAKDTFFYWFCATEME